MEREVNNVTGGREVIESSPWMDRPCECIVSRWQSDFLVGPIMVDLRTKSPFVDSCFCADFKGVWVEIWTALLETGRAYYFWDGP